MKLLHPVPLSSPLEHLRTEECRHGACGRKGSAWRDRDCNPEGFMPANSVRVKFLPTSLVADCYSTHAFYIASKFSWDGKGECNHWRCWGGDGSTAPQDMRQESEEGLSQTLSSLFEKLRPYDVRSTNWYPQYFATNAQQIQKCIDKARPRGAVKWTENVFGSWVTSLSDDADSEVLEIVLLGVDPPIVENVATIQERKEFQALHEDCLEAQRKGKISADAKLIFIRVPIQLLAETVASDLAQGRHVIIASCHEDQRGVVYESYKKLLETTSQKERLEFTALRQDAPRPLPPESRRWSMMGMMGLWALLPTIGLSASLLVVRSCPTMRNSAESRQWQTTHP